MAERFGTECSRSSSCLGNSNPAGAKPNGVCGLLLRTVFGRRFAPPEAVKSLGNFPELGRKAQAAIPNAKLVPLDNVGHVPHVEVPDLFVKTVLEFLNAKS